MLYPFVVKFRYRARLGLTATAAFCVPWTAGCGATSQSDTGNPTTTSGHSGVGGSVAGASTSGGADSQSGGRSSGGNASDGGSEASGTGGRTGRGGSFS